MLAIKTRQLATRVCGFSGFCLFISTSPRSQAETTVAALIHPSPNLTTLSANIFPPHLHHAIDLWLISKKACLGRIEGGQGGGSGARLRRTEEEEESEEAKWEEEKEKREDEVMRQVVEGCGGGRRGLSGCAAGTVFLQKILYSH